MAFAHPYLQMSRLMFTIQFLDKFEPPDPHQWQTLVQHDHRDHSPCLPHPGISPNVIGLAIKMPRDFTNQYVSPFPNLLNLGLQFVVDVIYIYIRGKKPQ
jgi:hypothetical protein